MKGVKIAPSVLTGDLGDLERAVRICEEGGADQVHLDVIDGHFAPNITFGPGTVKALRKVSSLKFDTHLMIEQPDLYAKKFIEAGSDLLTFHAEVLDGRSFDSLWKIVNEAGKEVGLAIKPGTEFPPWAAERVDKVSTFVVMTVNPGFSGQKMDMGVLPKLEQISKKLKEVHATTEIEVDGGVEPENAREVVKKGGEVLVAGAGVYSKVNPVAAIGDLRRHAEGAE